MSNVIPFRKVQREPDVMAPLVLWCMGVSLLQVAALSMFYMAWHR